MITTLVVSYTPRKGSYTKQLVEEFMKLASDKTEITCLDLTSSPPDLLLADNLNLIWSGDESKYTEENKKRLSNHIQLTQQVLDADVIVLASPMYNFSLPATVKAWVDAIVVKDKTFTFVEGIGFKGLCEDKKALILAVAGADYLADGIEEYYSPTIKKNFEYIGISSKQVSAFGVNQYPEKADTIVSKAKEEISEIIDNYYS